MLYNCLVVLLSCIISTVGCSAINILSYLILILWWTLNSVMTADSRYLCVCWSFCPVDAQ